MKKLLIATVFLLPFMAKAQNQPSSPDVQNSSIYGYKIEDKYVYYGGVVQVDTSFTVNDLYKDAKLFITKMALVNYKITSDDKTGGILTLDIDEPSTYKTQTGIGNEPMDIKYSVKLELKKGRYRYTFDNIIVTFKNSDDKNVPHTLFELDKDKGGGILGVAVNKRVLKAMDQLFVSKIDLLAKTMSKRSDDF